MINLMCGTWVQCPIDRCGQPGSAAAVHVRAAVFLPPLPAGTRRRAPGMPWLSSQWIAVHLVSYGCCCVDMGGVLSVPCINADAIKHRVCPICNCLGLLPLHLAAGDVWLCRHQSSIPAI